jgi:hypothetical protein
MEKKGLKARPGLLPTIVIVVMFAIAFALRHLGIICSQVFTVTAPENGTIVMETKAILLLALELILSMAAAQTVVFILYFQIEVKPKKSE